MHNPFLISAVVAIKGLLFYLAANIIH